MRFYSWMAAVAMLIFSGVGCVRTTQPILKDEQLVVDQSLVGMWVSKEGDQSFEVQPPNEEKAYKVRYFDKDAKKGNFRVRLGKIGELLVAEIQPEEPAPDASDVYKAHLLPLYSFLVIQKTTPELSVSTMSAEWLKKYVDAHPEELQVARMKQDDFVVTATTAEFQAFLLRHLKDADAMGEAAIFVRPAKPDAPK